MAEPELVIIYYCMLYSLFVSEAYFDLTLEPFTYIHIYEFHALHNSLKFVGYPSSGIIGAPRGFMTHCIYITLSDINFDLFSM